MTHQLTVMMPVYNGAKYVGAAIESILSQTFRAFELLVVDDGSTDDTPALLSHYAANDPRIRVFRRPRQGQVASRNELLRLARTEIVACADADDICLPDRFEQQMPAMLRDSSLLVLGTAMISIDDRGRRRGRRRVTTGASAVAADLERGCCIGHPSCMMRREKILAIGGYRAAYEAAEDYDLFLRASEHGKVDNLAIPGVLYREHGESVSKKHALRQAISTDLARATHQLRVAGRPDPTAALTAPPDLDSPILDAVIPPAQLNLHRAIAVTTNSHPAPQELDRALRCFLSAPIGKKHARAAQRAIIGLLGQPRPFDIVTARVAARAISLGPGRFLRLLWSNPRPHVGASTATPPIAPDKAV